MSSDEFYVIELDLHATSIEYVISCSESTTQPSTSSYSEYVIHSLSIQTFTARNQFNNRNSVNTGISYVAQVIVTYEEARFVIWKSRIQNLDPFIYSERQ
jgi:hypothetical protein